MSDPLCVQLEDRTMPPWNYYSGPGAIALISGDELHLEEDEADADDMGFGTVYLEKVEPTPNDLELLERAKDRNQLSKVIEQFGTWVVTTYGMECLTWYYPIISGRIGKDEPFRGWPEHMRRKTWVNVADFEACYKAAIKYHKENTLEPRPTTSIPVVKLMRDMALKPRRRPKSRQEPKAGGERAKGVLRLRFLILKRDGYCCRLCGYSAEDGVKLHVDHIVPKAKGGKNEESNLWTLCSDCNLGKGTLDV